MRTHLFVAAVAIATLPSCYQFAVSAHAGVARLALDGDIGYVGGASATSVAQDVDSAFGLGDDQNTVTGRLAIDTGVPVLAVSGFLFDEQGRGVLQSNFGNTFAAGLPVRSDFELTNVKGSYAFQIGMGPVSISPGIAVDYFDLSLEVRDQFGFGVERAELQAPIPLGFLRAEVDLGIVSLLAEGGYMKIDVDDVEMKLLDIEAMLMIRPTAMLDLFVGYRLIELDGDGDIDGDTFEADFKLSGLMIGGGIRF
jgi:hypothetical protein